MDFGYFFPLSFLCSVFQGKCDSKVHRKGMKIWTNLTVKLTVQIVPFQVSRVTKCSHFVLILEWNKKQKKNKLIGKKRGLELSSVDKHALISICSSSLIHLVNHYPWKKISPRGRRPPSAPPFHWPVFPSLPPSWHEDFLSLPPLCSPLLSQGLTLFYFCWFHHWLQSLLPPLTKL